MHTAVVNSVSSVIWDCMFDCWNLDIPTCTYKEMALLMTKKTVLTSASVYANKNWHFKLGAHESNMLQHSVIVALCLSILLLCAVTLLQDSDHSRPISGYQTCLIIFVIHVTLLLVCAELKHFAYGFSQESMR